MNRAAAGWYTAGEAPGGPPPGRGGAANAIDAALLGTPILIVEDEAMIAWTLESLFNDMGFTTVVLAPTGDDAIAAAGASRPGLIVSDINLGSGIDGIDAAAAIVATAVVPVIFVSGYASQDVRGRIARRIPGAVILPKPVQADALRQAIVAILQAPRRH